MNVCGKVLMQNVSYNKLHVLTRNVSNLKLNQ